VYAPYDSISTVNGKTLEPAHCSRRPLRNDLGEYWRLYRVRRSKKALIMTAKTRKAGIKVAMRADVELPDVAAYSVLDQHGVVIDAHPSPLASLRPVDWIRTAALGSK
jgi:hypothetical protein